MAPILFAVFFVGANALMFNASKSGGAPGKCLVWHSQHKSGGQTITNRLWRTPMKDSTDPEQWKHCGANCAFICDKQTWSCEDQKCVEPASLKSQQGYRLALRGYVQTLRGSPTWGEAGDGKCVWATMSREPVARVVSAYLYCKHEFRYDPLCGASRLDAREATIQEFAQHWGNYLFRELLLFPELRALAESRPDFNPTKYCRVDKDGLSVGSRGREHWEDPWLQVKDQLNGGDSIETESGKKNFQAVKDHLLGQNGYKPLYDVLGLLEEWEDTLHLFEQLMPMHGASWMGAVGHLTGGTHNSWKYADEKVKVLDEAKRDPVVLRAIAGDIALYNEVIVPMFHKEVAKYKSTH